MPLDLASFVVGRTTLSRTAGTGLKENASSSSSSVSAYVVAPSSLADGNWYLDSGASHHLASDISNLHIHSQYEGPDQICVGNGNTLPIAHVGTTSFSTPTRIFHFHKLYHVPNISANLRSISQFAKMMMMFTFEFHPLCLLLRITARGTALHFCSCCFSFRVSTIMGSTSRPPNASHCQVHCGFQ